MEVIKVDENRYKEGWEHEGSLMMRRKSRETEMQRM